MMKTFSQFILVEGFKTENSNFTIAIKKLLFDNSNVTIEKIRSNKIEYFESKKSTHPLVILHKGKDDNFSLIELKGKTNKKITISSSNYKNQLVKILSIIEDFCIENPNDSIGLDESVFGSLYRNIDVVVPGDVKSHTKLKSILFNDRFEKAKKYFYSLIKKGTDKKKAFHIAASNYDLGDRDFFEYLNANYNSN